MAKAKWYIEVDSYWQNSPLLFIGPFASRAAAQAAANASDAVHQSMTASDVHHNVRYVIKNTTGARRRGMRDNNIVSNLNTAVPSNTEELSRLWNRINY